MSAESLVIRVSEVKSRPIRWAWTGRLAIGYLTLQTGIEALGKSAFAAWKIARLTHGDLPGEWRGEPVDVLIVASEDGIADTWKPRLVVGGADTDRVAFLKFPPGWDLRDGTPDIARAVHETSARFVYIDAALDHMPAPRGSESVNSPTFVRSALAPFKRMVRDLDLVGEFSMHPPKAYSADFRGCVQASQAFVAVARVGLLFAYHPDDRELPEEERRRVLIRGMGNIGRNPGALEFRVAGREHKHDNGQSSEVAVVEGVEPSSITMADLAPDRMIGAHKPTKGEQAAEVLREALCDGGWHLADPIHKRLGMAGLDGPSVVKAACGLVGVEKRKRPGETDGPWEWRLEPASDSSSLPPLAQGDKSSATTFDLEGGNPSSNGKNRTIAEPVPPDGADRRLSHQPDYAHTRAHEANGADIFTSEWDGVGS
jgi:AAA domain